MTAFNYRQFQDELRKLDGHALGAVPAKKLSKQEAEVLRMERARAEFLILRERYKWTLADVVALFPPEEGIDYLKAMVTQPTVKLRKRRTPKGNL